MARTVIYGISRQHGVQHQEDSDETNLEVLQRIAEGLLRRFDKVEVWVLSICVLRLPAP